MSDSRDRIADDPAPLPTLEEWQALLEQARRIAAAWAEKEAHDDGFSIVDPLNLADAYSQLNASLLANPATLLEAQQHYWQDTMALWSHALLPGSDDMAQPLAEPTRGDRRFKDPDWNETPVFDCLRQSYLLAGRHLQNLIAGAEGLDPKTRERVEFFSRQFISAMSPSNFAATNPAVLKLTQQTGGRNLVEGMKHMLDDLEQGQGELKISMTDMAAFHIGENVATTPGKVVYQNELMQLIQYSPSTEQVRTRPLLIVPPWINKFYILDLQPKNSFIKWIVDQGYTLFLISWVNPHKELAHKTFDDYMREGPLAALEAIEQATGEQEANILGFCIGGILVEALLAWMAARGDQRITSATLLASMLDFQDVGEVSVFIDDELIVSLEEHMEDKGYLEGKHMAQMFNMMRENDLIWSFVVNNYLLGREPIPFDLLYWNSDSTRLPAAMLLYYLKEIYLRNGLIQPDSLELNGEKIDVGRIKTPAYVLATRDDHIAPWVSCYPVTQRFAGPVRFVLGGSGHIAGVVNPPAAKKYGYATQARYPKDPQAWLDKASWHEGSWWTDWGRWLARKSGPKVAARIPGDGALKPIEDAPGSYVKVSQDA